MLDNTNIEWLRTRLAFISALSAELADIKRLLTARREAKYNPRWREQPRAPKGSAEGGQWVDGGGRAPKQAPQRRAPAPRQAQPATPAPSNDNTPQTRLRFGPTAALAAGDVVLRAVTDAAERRQVQDALARFGLNPSSGRDVVAARAYVRAQYTAPLLAPSVPFNGPRLEAAAQAIMRNELAFPGTLARAEAGDPRARAALVSVANDAALNRPAAASPRSAPTPGFVTYADDEASLVHAMRAAGANRAQIEAALENLRDQRPLRVLELLQRAPGHSPHLAAIDMAHTLDGEVRRSPSGALHPGGGHYARSRNIEIFEITRPRDANGVFEARIRIRDPRTGRFVVKRARSSFFPELWSRRRVQMEIESAWANSRPRGGGLWEGTSSSGLRIRGYYQRPQGDAATAWPVHGDTP